jgi:hypothetical protein
MSCPKCDSGKKHIPWPWLVALTAIAVIAIVTYTAS